MSWGVLWKDRGTQTNLIHGLVSLLEGIQDRPDNKTMKYKICTNSERNAEKQTDERKRGSMLHCDSVFHSDMKVRGIWPWVDDRKLMWAEVCIEPWLDRMCGGKGTASSVLSSCSRSFLAVRLRIWSCRRWFSCCREWSDWSISTTRRHREDRHHFSRAMIQLLACIFGCCVQMSWTIMMMGEQWKTSYTVLVWDANKFCASTSFLEYFKTKRWQPPNKSRTV